MTSKGIGASEHALIDLIYLHLKKNGYVKAASALGQHVQVETTNVQVSLDDIFKKWVSDEGNDPQKHSVSKPKSCKKATHKASPKKKVKPQAPATDRSLLKKESETKTGEDSDSDSSLDVEKWKRLALHLSDADIAKLDVFTNINTSTTKSTKKRKLAQPKTKQTQTTGDRKRSSKKTKDKTSTSTTKTFGCAEPRTFKSPGSKMVTSLSDQVATPKKGKSNGLSESDRIKVKRKKTHNLSESLNIETPTKQAESEKTDMSDPTHTDTSHKKTKSKKHVKVTKPESLETPCRVIDAEVAIQKSQSGVDPAELSESDSSKQLECVLNSELSEAKFKKHKSKKRKRVDPVGVDTPIQTEDATDSITLDQAKIKKKYKKSKEPQEQGDVTMPEESQIEVDNSYFKPYQTDILSASFEKEECVVGSEVAEKQSKKVRKSLLESGVTENEFKKTKIEVATSISELPSSEKPSKKSKTKKRSETNQVDSPSKNADVDAGEDVATKSSFLKSDHGDNQFKKSKRKRAESSEENVTSSGAEHVLKSSSECNSSGVDNSLIVPRKSTGNQAVEEEENPEPKKKNKKHKEKKKMESEENVDTVPSAPPAEEFADSLLSSAKKKKKKKQKSLDEEMPSVCTAALEEESAKKKRKLSKEKEHVDLD